MNKKFFTAKNVAVLGILVALVVVLQLFASAIPMFGVTLNFSLIPIALAGITLGCLGGTIVGFTAGLVIFITMAVMGGEPFTAFLFQTNPLILTIICIGKTTIAGFVSGLLFKVINDDNQPKRKITAVFISSFVIPIINTGIYLLGMVIMKDSLAHYFSISSTAGVVFGFVFGIIWLNSIIEIAITAILTPVIYRVVRVIKL